MLDAVLNRSIAPFLYPVTAVLARSGIKPVHITLSGAIFGIVCMGCLVFGFYPAALILLAFNRLCDGFDGALARYNDKHGRKNGTSAIGAYLDIVCDMLFYAGFVLSFAIGIGTVKAGFAAAFLLFSFMATATSFLTHAVIAAKYGIKTSSQQTGKGIYYSRGLIEGSETILCFTIMLLYPAGFMPIAMIFGTLCLITATIRIVNVWRDYNNEVAMR